MENMINKKPQQTLLSYMLFIGLALFSLNSRSQKLYDMPKNTHTRWASFENIKSEKGEGGKENNGAKGHPFDRIKAGKTVTLLDVQGSGTVKRIWMTISDRSPEMLRALKIEMFWDGSSKPAVSVPLGDFFGEGLGIRTPFESALFSNPEGRSFNCIIPMPFKNGAKITLTNESSKNLEAIFYDVNLLKGPHKEKDLLYFHAYWHRSLHTSLQEDFKILPKVEGKGRFLGTNLGVATDKLYQDTWFGEGEVKIHLDGDGRYPTLVGTGTEDYIGTAYGQQTFSNQYQGSLVADPQKGIFTFYRYHIPDPVYFYDDIKVTIQQIGGAPRDKVRELLNKGAKLLPITVDHNSEFNKLLEEKDAPKVKDKDFPKGWTNFYRSDDVSATAYFYLNKPTSKLPAIQPLKERIEALDR